MIGQLIKRGENTWPVRIFIGRDANRKQKFHHKTFTAQSEMLSVIQPLCDAKWTWVYSSNQQ
jgi:hypothetical protein